MIEPSESIDSRTTADLIQAIRANLDAHDAAPYRPNPRDLPSLSRPVDQPPPPPSVPKPQPRSPPPARPLLWNPRISQARGFYGPIPEHYSTAAIEDVTDAPDDPPSLPNHTTSCLIQRMAHRPSLRNPKVNRLFPATWGHSAIFLIRRTVARPVAIESRRRITGMKEGTRNGNQFRNYMVLMNQNRGWLG